jgi:Tol biopolymer transport system component
MKPILISIILATIFAFGNINLSMAQTPEQLYQKGLGKEEGEGALQDAIKLYNQIADNSNADKSLQAKALLHVGMCYEKLGMKEATKAYQRLVNNFPAQKNEVAIARERLSRLIQIADKITEAPLTPKFTKIKIPSRLSWTVTLSPDGKDLALVSDGKLWKMPLSGNLGPEFPGTPVQLNTEGIKVDWTGLSWSGDGKWIAFNDIPTKGSLEQEKDNQSIFIVPSNGGKPKKVIENYRYVRTVNYKISLSPDGSKLAYTSIENDKQHVYTTVVSGGTPKQLMEIEAREPVFSPDGKWISYVEDKNMGVGGGNLWIAPANGGVPRLVAKAGMAFSPIWSPDGSTIAFFDDDKKGQINFIRVPNSNEAVGKVTSIEAPPGTENIGLAGWTSENKIGVLLRSKVEYSLYTLPLKGGQGAIVLNDCFAVQPRWSPDGKQIIYAAPLKEGSEQTAPLRFASVSANGGTGKPLAIYQEGESINLKTYQGGNRVSPDGKWIISAAWTSEDTSFSNPLDPYYKIWKIPVDGSKSIQLTNKQGPYADLAPCWSPDGKKVAFLRFHITKSSTEESDEAGIYIINSSGGEPEILTSISGKYIFSPVWSPDGKMIAYFTKEKEAPHTSCMNVIDVGNGENRIVGNVPDVYANCELDWSPESKQIAFNIEYPENNLIKVMNLSDGSVSDINTNLQDVKIYHFDWSPNGERFVFGGYKGGDREFWFLEDFLPLEKLAQRKGKEDLSIRKALANTDVEPLGTPSPDGRYISFVDWNSGGNICILDLETKEKRQLTDFKDPYEQAYYSSWSTDGNNIAYTWWDKVGTNLSVVDIKESKSRVLLKSDKVDWIELGNWSSDGKYIFATLSLNEESKSQIIRVSADDGTIKVLKTCEESYTGGKPYISPDNRFVAFDLPDKDALGNGDIYLLSLENGLENPLIKHPSHDYILGWTPDGKNILFASDRTGTVDAMIIAVEEGKPAGNPRPVKQNIGPVVPMGFTQDGSFYYGQWPGADNIYSAEIDFDEGKLLSNPTLLIQKFEGRNYSPDYSSDGKYLAYISRRGVINKGEPGRVLCIRNLETGKENEIIPDPEIWGGISDPQWSPDNRSIALACDNKDGYSRIYRYDTQTKQLTPLVTESEGQSSNIEYAYPIWSNDGKSIFYLQLSRYSTTSRIMVRNIETGIDRELFQYSSDDFMDRLFNISLSPDGKWLAAINRGENRVLKVFSTEGGNFRDLYSFKLPGGWPFSQVWSRDGKYIVFPYNEEEGGWNLMRIALDGGGKHKIKLNIIGISSPSLHPDGRTLAFRSAGSSMPENNIWEMKNFLPK